MWPSVWACPQRSPPTPTPPRSLCIGLGAPATFGHLGSIHPGCPTVGAHEVGACAGSPSRAAGPHLLRALTTVPMYERDP